MIVVWLPNTWQHTMVIASVCVGLTLPGMIEEPGSFSGRINSPSPERGPEPSRRMSLAILNSAGRDRIQRAVREHQRVVRGQRLELVGRGDEGQPGQRGDPLGDALGELRLGIEPGADGGAALRQRIERLERQPACARCQIFTCAA